MKFRADIKLRSRGPPRSICFNLVYTIEPNDLYINAISICRETLRKDPLEIGFPRGSKGAPAYSLIYFCWRISCD